MLNATYLALWRFSLIIFVFLFFTPIYWVTLKFSHSIGHRFGRFYLSTWRKCIGHQLIVKGDISHYKPTLFIVNHSSYIDILICGTFIPGKFVAKKEVSKWPIIGWLATKQGTVYIDRKRTAIADGAGKLYEEIDKGENLILFPEGTTSDGCRILPFGSSFFDVAMKKNLYVQPITITYAGWDGMPMPRFVRKICGWASPKIGLFSHLWIMAQLGRVQVIAEVHPLLKASDFSSRKELSKECWNKVQSGLTKAFSMPISHHLI